ncbi:MAG: sodium/proline symporter PutP [Treponema sp.]|nr:sodium/proline symporter PutP [Treponema sp.]
MTSSTIALIIAFVLYLGFMVFIGLRNMKKNTSAGDFFLGGRELGPWMTALSAEASDMSGWLLMGLPGLAYLGGMKEAFWTAVGLAVGTYLSWLIVAKPLRKCTVAFGNSITIPEFLTNRFNDKKHLISSIMVIFNLLFFTIYVASGFVACAKLLNSVFGLPYHVGLVVGLIVILSYTITGGYRAVCSTDFVQGTLMFISLMITGVVMLVVLGGPSAALDKVHEFSQRAMSGEFNNISEKMQDAFTRNQNFGVVAIISSVVWGLGYFGMPHFIVRFMGIRSASEIKLSRRIAIVWVIVALGVAVIVGSLGTVYLPKILNTSAAETVFSESIKLMFPAFVAGIFLCAILAAAMSTADSQLLVASSSFSQDLYKGLFKPNASDKEVLNVSRITVFVISAIAFVIALDQNSSIFSLVSYAWAGFGSTIGPLILLALFWKGTTRNGALVGLIVGAVTVILWHSLHGGIFDVYEILPGFMFCMIATILVSLIDRKVDPETLQKFDEYKAMND